MCPDRQIICLYYDNELPSPWKEKLEKHLESCAACRKILSEYEGMGAFVHKEKQSFAEHNFESVKERVWAKLFINENKRQFKRERNFIWNRSVSLPLPALAAAALVLVILFISIMGTFSNIGFNGMEITAQNDAVTLLSDHVQMGIADTANIQDINEIFEFLNTQDTDNIVIIPLPDNRRFYPSGEPVLINAADYSRRFSPR